MMNCNELSNLLLHYGTITSDISLSESNTRIRTFSYNGKSFYHRMKNGIVIDCYEITTK